MGDKRQPGRPKAIDRDHVIDVAMEAWWCEGTDGVSLNEVCRRAGASKPSVYREFGGEDGLMDVVLERYSERFLAPVLGWTQEDRPFREILDRLIEFMIVGDPDTPPGCLLAKMRVLSSNLGPATEARVSALRTGARAAYTAWVTKAQTAGEIDAQLDPATAGAFLDSQMTALLVQAGLGEAPDSLRAQARLTFAGLVA